MYISRPYQELATDAAVNFIKYDEGNGIINLPTASGKSVVIAKIAERLPGRGLVLADRKELLEQNGEKFSAETDFGFYSAGLGIKKTHHRITIAGIQSATEALSNIHYDWIIVDECDRVPNNTEKPSIYWNLIKKIGARVIGLTATPFRLESSNTVKLTWGKIIYEYDYQSLLNKGWITPLTNKVPFSPTFKAEVRGDYILSQLGEEMIDRELIRVSVERIIHYAEDRKSILLFVTTIKHGEVLQKALEENGIISILATGKTPKAERKEIVRQFRNGMQRFVINCGLWTRGFDAPNIDMIGVLRPTKSKALHEQILGRGVRQFAGKSNCLVLDLAGNLNEHGGLGTPFKEKRKGLVDDEPKGRICPLCEEYTPPKSEFCPDCGYVFPENAPSRTVNHNKEPDTKSDLVYDPKKKERIGNVMYFAHQSKSGNLTLRVDYIYAESYGGKVSEYLSPFHENDWVKGKAYQFFAERGVHLDQQIETYSIEELIEEAQYLKKPIYLSVDRSDKYPRIINYEWESAAVNQSIDLDEDSIPF